MNTKITVGMFCVGLDTYWSQFSGLKNKILENHNCIKKTIEGFDVEVLDIGLIDNPIQARPSGEKFRKENVDAIFLYIATYALSSTVLPVIQSAGVPIIVLNIQPVKQLNYSTFNGLKDRGVMTGIWLEHCQACSAPEVASVLNRSGIDFNMVTGYTQDNETIEEIGSWIDAIRTCSVMKRNRVGLLGSYYGGMLDVYSDLTQQSAVFGNHFELLEMCELKKLRDETSHNEIIEKINEFKKIFKVSPECHELELERAARTAVALDKLVQEHMLGSLAYYYEGQDGNDYENIVTSVIAGNTILTGSNVPVAGEYEVKNVQAMKILDSLGVGGSFSEFYLADYEDDILYFGHDGPAHFAIAEGEVGLVPLPVYHGKPGKGLSIQMTVKHGPVTILAVVQQRNGNLALLCAEGDSVPGPILNIGNTNSRYKFKISVKKFLNDWCQAGPSHHCAIGVGHIGSTLEKLAAILNIDFIKVC